MKLDFDILTASLPPVPRSLPDATVRPAMFNGCSFNKRGKVARVDIHVGDWPCAQRLSLLHEIAGHAKHSKMTKPNKDWHPMTTDIFEDWMVHNHWLPRGKMTKRQLRDETATAAIMLRYLTQHELAASPDRPAWLNMLCQCIVMLHKAHPHVGDVRLYKLLTKLRDRCVKLTKTLPAISQVMICQASAQFFKKDKLPSPITRKKVCNAISTALWALETKRDKPAPGAQIGSDGDSNADVTMSITEPPRTKPTAPKIPTPKSSSVGTRVRASRLARAYVTGETTGLFVRKVTQPAQGVVLIDASGSMNFDDDQLQQLCNNAPGATVAFYSGFGQHGNLVIYAKNGLRMDYIPSRGSSNAVDYFALKWMLSHPGPYTLISDLGFNCVNPKYTQKAFDLLACRPDVKIVEDISHLLT